MSIKKIHIYVIDDGILNRKNEFNICLRFSIAEKF